MTEKEFVDKLYTDFSKGEKKVFPDSFLKSEDLEKIDLPGKVFIPGKQLFDQYEIISVDGEIVMQFDNFLKCKYLVYASRNSKRPVYIPAEVKSLEIIVNQYENYVDSIIQRIQKEFKKNFPDSLNLNRVTNQLINKLNLARY